MCYASCFVKKIVRNDFKTLKLGILIVLVSIGLFLFYNEVLADTIFTDDFYGYTGFELNGQGGWESCPDYIGYSSLELSTTTYYLNEPSAFCRKSVWGKCSEKTGNQVETGRISFYANISGGDNSNAFMKISGSTSTKAYWRFGNTGNIDYYSSSLVWENVCNVEPDTWFWLGIEWSSITDQIKYTCESAGVYQTSGWVEPAFSPTIEYFSKVQLYGTGNHPNVYFDYFGETGFCKFYKNYETCSNAGCLWYYSIYTQEYYCIPFVEPDPDECGSFYKCQYCSDQTTCEEQLNCEWIDRGYGVRCYMIEPTIPPDQADWEIPDMEDCSGLAPTPRLLCEIKNLISSVIMPSQEKLVALYQTLGAFKEKFPFNYIDSLDNFFKTISESLDQEKSIPIKILGHESNINFTFWNSTTTIGDQVETFKNVWFDSTTMIILIGWFMWLISWIRRFF
jgi:hypothetical protein